ncbi:MAG TPA: hypothetical protein VF789_05895 [Thermoanaerobaculia bacterium]
MNYFTVDQLIDNRVCLLLLIRDGHVRAQEDLEDLLLQVVGAEERQLPLRIQLRSVLRHRVQELINTGFVKETDSGYEAVGLVHNLKPVLNISLSDLAEIPPGAIWIHPVTEFQLGNLPRTGADAFVLMPFSADLAPVYEDHIKSVASKLGLSIARADDFFTTNAIVSDIWAGIFQSKIIIADCTGRNPNVFYEIGIAHTLGKPVILITQSLADVPFDLRYRKCLEYELTPRGMAKFEESLESTIRNHINA